MHKTAIVFLRFLQRDVYIQKQRIGTFLINYGIIYPTIYSFAIGYIMANTYFGNTPLQGSALFIGHILVIIVAFANSLNIGLLFDFEHQRCIDYQITLLSPHLILLERILFASLFTFVISIPFFPIAALILGKSFVTTHTSWPKMFLVLYISSLCCSAYTQFTACVIPSSHKLRSFWMRVNFGLINFGGIFIPWYLMKQFSSLLGYITLLNPLLYVTEGLRSAILNRTEFLPVWICIGAMLIFSILFTLLSFYFFKKRVDHI